MLHSVDAGCSPAPAALGAGWIAQLTVNDPARRRCRSWLLVALCVYAAAMVLFVPFGIGSSWRECDTQAIARNFLSDGWNPLRPRIDWRGDTDGAVECEFPLYQSMIAAVMGIVGEAEWPGRIIAMLAMLMATLSLHRLLEARTGPGGALVGSLVFLGSGQAVLLGTRVMPDALSLALAIAGTAAFVQFLAEGRGRTLFLATVMTALACLVKPTALQIGLLQFLWLLAVAPRRLRELRVWISAVTVLGVVGLWMAHGIQLHADTGLTFGVAAGGETKFPTGWSLRKLSIWTSLGWTTLQFGFGGLGVIGLLVAVARRRFSASELALVVVAGLGLVGTLRYSFHGGIGPHYHAFAAVAGSWLVACAWPRRAHWALWGTLLLVVVLLAGVHIGRERAWRQGCLSSGQLTAGAAVESMSKPSELAVVRSFREGYDAFWRRRTNYEDPVLLYHARRRGWVLPADGFEPDALNALRNRGAAIVVDQTPASTSVLARQWLDANADQAVDSGGCRIYRLRARS